MKNFVFIVLLFLPSQVLASPCADLLLGVDPISEFIRLELDMRLKQIGHDYGVDFIGAEEPAEKAIYSAKRKLNRWQVEVPRQYLDKPEESLKEVIRLARLFRAYRLLHESTDLPWPQVISSDHLLRLEGEELRRHPTLKWMMERMERYNASVFFGGDQVFQGECARAGAYAQCSSIVIQIDLLEEILAGHRDDLIAHEFHHIANDRRCELYGDCLRLIEFVSNEVNLYTGQPLNEVLTLQGFDSYKTLYGKYFRSDEVEAYYISARFSVPAEKKIENLRVSLHFATQQIYYMSLALERLQSGIILQRDQSGIIPIVHREKSINVKLKRVDLPIKQAVEVYSDQLKSRIRQLKNLKKRLRKELLESKGGF